MTKGGRRDRGRLVLSFRGSEATEGILGEGFSRPVKGLRMTEGNVNVIQRERMGWAACHSEGAERPKES